ncbi:MAG: response regulator [Acidobacteria bacterium]|nr:response regulator [Acidobacteriota bacterium]
MISASKTATERPKIVCVDDEPNVLAGLSLHLRRQYQVLTAGSGAEGLDTLRQHADTAVVISDMRMPGMDGAAFLGRCRGLLPDVSRMLLTGHADSASAIQAVNEGQIFRFLVKPCPPALLAAAVDAAVQQHRLLTSERVLLEETLHGSIKALVEVLGLANPIAFGRANRIKQLVSDLAFETDGAIRWQVEVAAMLSQLGCMSLPPDTLERLYYGRPLSEAEQEMVSRVPAITERLLSSIPRLEGVRGMLASYHKPAVHAAGRSADESRNDVRRGADLLAVATEFEALTAQGQSTCHAVDVMRGRTGRYHPGALDALGVLYGNSDSGDSVQEVSLGGLRVGTIFAEDVTLTSGALLAARGFEVTENFVERARNFKGMVREPIRVVVKRADRSPQ